MFYFLDLFESINQSLNESTNQSLHPYKKGMEIRVYGVLLFMIEYYGWHFVSM